VKRNPKLYPQMVQENRNITAESVIDERLHSFASSSRNLLCTRTFPPYSSLVAPPEIKNVFHDLCVKLELLDELLDFLADLFLNLLNHVFDLFGNLVGVAAGFRTKLFNDNVNLFNTDWHGWLGGN